MVYYELKEGFYKKMSETDVMNSQSRAEITLFI